MAAIIIDSYPIGNRNTGYGLDNTYTKYGQAITGQEGNLKYIQWVLRKVNSATGSAYAKLYNITGTFGTNAEPTGAALATSDAVDVSTFSGSYGIKSFIFSGANRYFLGNGTKYIATIEYDGGDATDYIAVGADSTSPSHAGNWSYYTSGSWTANNTIDFVFYARIVNEGLRVYTSGGTKRIKVETLTAAHKLRIDVNGTTFGVPLIGTGDAGAGGVRVYDGAATKSLYLY